MNYLNDLDYTFTNYPQCSGCKVQAGFYRTYLAIKAATFDCLTYMKATYPNGKLVVTGHSLGAAMAGYAALEMNPVFSPCLPSDFPGQRLLQLRQP
jgi:putative lipase involved disintegration of autophagic bodies